MQTLASLDVTLTENKNLFLGICCQNYWKSPGNLTVAHVRGSIVIETKVLVLQNDKIQAFVFCICRQINLFSYLTITCATAKIRFDLHFVKDG